MCLYLVFALYFSHAYVYFSCGVLMCWFGVFAQSFSRAYVYFCGGVCGCAGSECLQCY